MKKAIVLCLGMGITLFSSQLVFAEDGGAYTTDGTVTFMPSTDPTNPVDPTNPDPDKPVNPTNPYGTDPTPGTAGPLSIDFASSLQFGEQKITSTTETYYAATQKYTTKEGTATEGPNYVQVTDNRGTEKGWVLKVKQNGQLKNADGKELTGAKITLNQGNVVTNSSSAKPAGNETIVLTPASDVTDSENYGAESLVMNAEKSGGAGTYLHAWGSDAETAAKSIALEVPGSTTKYATQYTTTFTWTLSEIPEN